jgi:L-threonylcarbamoyladenylate synthase
MTPLAVRPGAGRTLLMAVDPARPDPDVVRRAAEVIVGGGLVAFPTETVYGLGADALNPDAVRRVFAVKGRPPDNPLIVHIAAPEGLEGVAVRVPPRARALASAFWPGPLTLVLPRAPRVPLATTGGLDTVAVRMPAHPVALALIRAAGRPIAAPSANRSGRPSPTTAAHVLEDLEGQVDVVLDGGPCPVGVESTVLDLTEEPPVILRPGGVPREALEAVLGRVRLLGEVPHAGRRSPGTRYRHYAPRAALLLADPEGVEGLVARLLREGWRVGLLTRRPYPETPGLLVRRVPQDPSGYARHLFALLRELDALGCQVIVAETVEEKGIGAAVMDRLRRAASSPFLLQADEGLPDQHRQEGQGEGQHPQHGKGH